MDSTYIATLVHYRELNIRTTKERSMATGREIELNRAKQIDTLIEAVEELTKTVKHLEEVILGKQESESTKKVSKISSKG